MSDFYTASQSDNANPHDRLNIIAGYEVFTPPAKRQASNSISSPNKYQTAGATAGRSRKKIMSLLLDRSIRAGCVLLLSTCASVLAAEPADPTAEFQRQDDRLRMLRQQHDPSDRFEPRPMATPTVRRLPFEAPCAAVDRVVIESPLDGFDATALAGPEGDDSPLGRCVGAAGVSLLAERLQDTLVGAGWITSRVHVPDQDTASGTLRFQVRVGRTAGVTLTTPSSDAVPPRSNLAVRQDAPLNLRDVEQTVDNLRRLPGADATVEIAPGLRAGTSDLLLTYTPPPRARLDLSVDDSGSAETGRLVGSATVSLQDLSGHSDLLYVTVGGAARPRVEGPRGARHALLHYSVPVGYSLLSFSTTTSRHHQTVFGPFQAYRFSGEATSHEMRVEHVVHRDARSKTKLLFGGYRRVARSFIDDTEISVQRRRSAGWDAGMQHSRHLGTLYVDGAITLRRGTGALGAQPAPEQTFGEGTTRQQLWRANLLAQWTPEDTALVFESQARAQWGGTPLTPPDRLCIGDRGTVRGFKGHVSACGDRGHVLRNEASLSLAGGSVRGYAALDTGRVGASRGGRSTGLTGAALGMRGAFRGPAGSSFSADVFVAAPVAHASGVECAGATTGLALGASF